MGAGRFSKKPQWSLFNDDLSNEPNFGRNHIAGQWTVSVKKNESVTYSREKIKCFERIAVFPRETTHTLINLFKTWVYFTYKYFIFSKSLYLHLIR